MLAAGVDAVEIQRGLGHADISMTGEYAGAYTKWKSVVADEEWPRGVLRFRGAPETMAKVGG